MAIEIQAPTNRVLRDNQFHIFLAGSIEMGKAEDWQSRIVKALDEAENIVLLNPRRSDWNPTWAQSKDSPKFREQVDWELDYIQRADLVVFVFDPETTSPITLLELGFIAGKAAYGRYNQDQDVVVLCPDGFYRKGNVDIVCETFGLGQLESFEELIDYIEMSYSDWRDTSLCF